MTLRKMVVKGLLQVGIMQGRSSRTGGYQSFRHLIYALQVTNCCCRLDWTNSGAPISQVLNGAVSTQHAPEPASTTQYVSAAPFSGKLIDLLLDTSQNLTHERRRAGDQPEETSRVVSENSIITLPQPAQPPAKTARRPRIPPLLQGLHQPPPLPPNGRLFPPITDGVSGFEQEICERIQSGNATQEARAKKDGDDFATRTVEQISPPSAHSKQNRAEQIPILSPISPGIKNSRKRRTEASPSDTAPVAQKQQGRKRKKWSDEETRDLLLGVSRLGIGNWKKILHCSDFEFQGRTAVDLKDRFRVCCPGDSSKPRKPKQRKGVDGKTVRSPRTGARPVVGEDVPNVESPPSESPAAKELFAEGAGDIHRMNHTELVKLGIHTPFAKSKRRARHAFSVVDDENLLKGFEKHGAAWQAMRDDKDLGFETRHPTDLRDRFRIRYPEAYERAGYKLKAKIKSRGRDVNAVEEKEPKQDPPLDSNQRSEAREKRSAKDNSRTLNDNELEERPVLRFPAARSSAHTSTTDLGPAFSNFAENDGSLSPIILNRNILQWADANTTTMSSTSNSVYFGTYLSRDPSAYNTIPHDGLHINPLATLKLPMLTLSDHTSSTLPIMQNYPTTINPVPSSSIDPALNWSSFQKPNSSSSQHNLLRTPNLPTIVFPHVPAISARTTVHNLPPPADLLSGMDLDGGEGVGAEHGGTNASAFGAADGR
ncbi:hypothetical protein CC86DRAFT_460047 [Ophiobolus disseminans]|uniref:Myb-like domain-containing protein n=1 Tax=Ophiobolus disseminans TaxID=1469910 RepID=A0A6A6ZGB9_9PLEO|nr:hypothetical protein CC86DRAFT_460047 [Ophiobolus disseminans]